MGENRFNRQVYQANYAPYKASKLQQEILEEDFNNLSKLEKKYFLHPHKQINFPGFYMRADVPPRLEIDWVFYS